MRIFHLFLCVLIVLNGTLCHYEDFSNGYHYEKIFPQEIMVDVINNFGVALLEAHNENNNNNIALSPYGATSVLIALGEGLRGYAVQEIQEAVHIPQDVSVIRVGLRDIHRHLKSYFIPKEGFLAGLTLNNEEVQLNDGYKEILRFYGFDLDSFNSPLYPDIFEMSTAMTLNVTESTVVVTTEIDEKCTENPMVSTINQTPTTQETTKMEVITEIATTSLPETTSNEDTQRTTRQVESTTRETSMVPSTTTTESITTLKVEITTIPDKPDTDKPDQTTQESTKTTTQIPEESTIETQTKPTVEIETTTPTTTPLAEITTTVTSEIPTTTATETTTNAQTTPLTDIDQTTNDVEATTTENVVETTTSTEDQNEETKKRSLRSIVDYIIARHYDNQLFKPTKFNYNNNYEPEEEPSFLIYGAVREPNINFMSYDAVLPISYLPHLNAMALSFPLDSKEYYLLLIVPIDETGIDKLIHDMAHSVSLRDIITSLRYAHVRAVIPSFMLKGYVILTPSLQKLGIQRIFEPRRTDFSLMTKEKDVYVTNIEQAVTVTIRNYVDADNLPNYRNLQRTRPVLFQADHPFLYFVMDTQIHVALMAGKIVNPLNSRIR